VVRLSTRPAAHARGQYDTGVFVEVTGEPGRLVEFSRDDVEELLQESLGRDGEVSGAGSGQTGWNLDLEVDDAADLRADVLPRLARALVDQGLGWVRLRVEGERAGRAASELADRGGEPHP
jgi:hypothetical protein